ncbi:multidrug transporter [Pseudonocardia sp. CNS-004]|nr:multidrug transporter [Pseudonocardia sp. CNS-004]
MVVLLSCAAQFMVVLDVSVVNVALPTIRDALGFDAAGAQWVVNGYGLTFAGFLLLGGRIADICGLRAAVVGGLALFGAASLVGGLADSPAVLVAARVAQGLGAAALAPATLTLLTTTFPEGPRRVRVIAWWTAVGLAGGTGGNMLGGAITEFVSWRWILLINVPLVAAALAVAMTRLRVEQRRPATTRLDLPGATTAVVGLTALTHGVGAAHDRGWGDPATLVALGAGLVSLVAFVVVEARFARAPLFPLRLLALRAVSVGNVLVVLVAVCLVPMWFFLAFLMQDGLGFSPFQTGMGFLPHTLITMVVGVWAAPRLLRRLGLRITIVVAAIVAALGFGWQWLNAIHLDGGYVEELLGPAILISVGGGLLNTPITAAVTSGVPHADSGAASGLMNTAKQFGGAVGLAVLVGAASGPSGLAYGPAFTGMAIVLAAVGVGACFLPRPAERGRALTV